jgi:hypothetical protein
VFSATELRLTGLDPNRPSLTSLPVLGEDNFIVLGWTHLFAGYPKVGKTEFLTRCCSEWCDQGHRVRYYSEEPAMVWEARLALLPPIENMDIVLALGMSAAELLEDMQAPADIVVIDTVRLLRLEDENSNSEINRALTPLIALTRRQHQTLILSHHQRKGAGDHGVAAAGGHAFLGAVDVALEISRAGDNPRRRSLRGWGRVVEVPTLIYEKLDSGELRSLGDPGALLLEEVTRRVLEEISTEWAKTKELRERLDEPVPSADTMNKALTALAKKGKIERDPPIEEKKQGATYRWKLPTPEAALPVPSPNLTSALKESPAEVQFEEDEVVRI